MKTCFKCGLSLPIEEFYRHPKMADGHLGKCKSCTKKDTQSRYQRVSLDGSWVARKRQDSRELYAALPTDERPYKKVTPQKRKGYISTYRERYPERRVADHAVNNALRSGRLIRKPCEVCGETKAQAHHDDYSKPLDVRWLCQRHHSEHHVTLRLAKL